MYIVLPRGVLEYRIAESVLRGYEIALAARSELLGEPVLGDLHRVGLDRPRAGADRAEDLPRRDVPAAILHEEYEQVEELSLDVQVGRAAEGGALHLVHGDGAVLEDVRLLPVCAAEHGVDVCLKLVDVERLGDVSVRAEAECLRPLGGADVSAHAEDGRCDSVPPHFPDEVAARHVGKLVVDERKSVVRLVHVLRADAARVGDFRLEAHRVQSGLVVRRFLLPVFDYNCLFHRRVFYHFFVLVAEWCILH